MKYELDHLSYSSISSYLTCGKAWKYKYIDKIPTKPSTTLILGSTVHDTMEEIIACRSVGMEEPNPVEFATETLNKRLENEKGTFIPEDLETLKDDVLRLVSDNVILSGLADIRAKVDDRGAQIERKVTLEIPEVDVPIIGFIDIVLEDGTPADFKTSSRAWTQERAEKEMQPIFYLAAMGQCGMPVNWHFKHLVMVKTKKPQFQILEHTHEPKELFSLFKQVQDVWKGIQSDVFNQAAPGSWKCSPRWCDYYDLCKGIGLE
ncbi:MAG: PD-(D/E)XK nuclease family protein [Verrucomicrobia bacterium]|nr:PD-(D/E)XK nuclease family protein [Verrucomicrobiota bacterium]